MKDDIPFFVEIPRLPPREVPVAVRVLGWNEIYGAFEPGQGEQQAARCIDCGNPAQGHDPGPASGFDPGGTGSGAG